MGNQFARSATEREPHVQISNNRAAVLFDLLSVAACATAQSDWEKGFALLCCDSARVGMGMDGFDLDELPFSPDSWQPERDFVLRTLQEAAGDFRGDVLDYVPTQMDRAFADLEALVAGYEPHFPLRSPVWRWPETLVAEQLQLCDQHPVFIGRFGACRFCRPDMD